MGNQLTRIKVYPKELEELRRSKVTQELHKNMGR